MASCKLPNTRNEQQILLTEISDNKSVLLGGTANRAFNIRILLGPGEAASAIFPFDIVVLTKILLGHGKAASAAFPFYIVILIKILLRPGKAASATFPFDIVILTKILLGLGDAASTGLKY